jgi:hypothetical protein
MRENIDLVYTWVDDRFPGYREQLERHAQTASDLNPNRTRENLDLLRFSLRSVEKFAPWIGRIHIVTCRPQTPSWLDIEHPRIRVVHHDEILDAQLLPTFNSFAIVSQLHRLPAVSRRFLYLEDDILFLNTVSMSDFAAQDGRIKVYHRSKQTPTLDAAKARNSSAWNMALANVNAALDQSYGSAQRSYVNYVPLLIDIEHWKNMMARWPALFDKTVVSRFRDRSNIAPEYLYPHYLEAEGLGETMSPSVTRRRSQYAGLENFLPLTAFRLMKADLFRPKFCNLNDNFGTNPNSLVERMVRGFLAKWFPVPSAFERQTLKT